MPGRRRQSLLLLLLAAAVAACRAACTLDQARGQQGWAEGTRGPSGPGCQKHAALVPAGRHPGGIFSRPLQRLARPRPPGRRRGILPQPFRRTLWLQGALLLWGGILCLPVGGAASSSCAHRLPRSPAHLQACGGIQSDSLIHLIGPRSHPLLAAGRCE